MTENKVPQTPEAKTPTPGPEKKKGGTRNRLSKKLFLCTSGIESQTLDQTSVVKVVAGPFASLDKAAQAVKGLPDGEYQAIYFGRRVTKATKQVSSIEVK